ncbi:hypothetical protein MMC07_003533 [Pseudocyphellaria aurata]|nr:hypothetical protein [Pseudocyphellaria aurata]
MHLYSVVATVASIGLLCTAAPTNSDLSHRSIPFTGVSHPDLFDDATHKESHLHTEIPVYKRDAKVEEASCFCPGTQKAVHYNGKCQCIDTHFVERDMTERDVANTEEATCFCPPTQIAVHYDGKCQCIDNHFVERDTTERDVANIEEASCFCPGTQKAVHYDGKCQCIDDHFRERDVLERDVAGAEEATCFCPGTQKAVHYNGKCQCIDTHFDKRDVAAHIGRCPICPARTFPHYYAWSNREKICICQPTEAKRALSPRSDEAEDILQPTALIPAFGGTIPQSDEAEGILRPTALIPVFSGTIPPGGTIRLDPPVAVTERRSNEAEDTLHPLDWTFEPGSCPYKCPVNTIANVKFTTGAAHCNCQPIPVSDRRKLLPSTKACPTGCLRNYHAIWYLFEHKRHCTCAPDNENEFNGCPRPGFYNYFTNIPCGDLIADPITGPITSPILIFYFPPPQFLFDVFSRWRLSGPAFSERNGESISEF